MSDRERLSQTMFGRKFGDRFHSRRINGRRVYLDIARRHPW
jgi:hypothetical protein